MNPFTSLRPRGLLRPWAAVLLASALLGAVPSGPAPGPGAPPVELEGPPALCAPDPGPPEYYRIPLVTTKKAPGTAYLRGRADVTFVRSPFVVAVAPDGSYAYDVDVAIPELPAPRAGGYVAWVTTTEVDRILRLGVLEDGRVRGRVSWNKFLVVVTLESDPGVAGQRWTGPVAFRGMSRSGMMHTMAGHGPFQQENCAAYGYE